MADTTSPLGLDEYLAAHPFNLADQAPTMTSANPLAVMNVGLPSNLQYTPTTSTLNANFDPNNAVYKAPTGGAEFLPTFDPFTDQYNWAREHALYQPNSYMVQAPTNWGGQSNYNLTSGNPYVLRNNATGQVIAQGSDDATLKTIQDAINSGTMGNNWGLYTPAASQAGASEVGSTGPTADYVAGADGQPGYYLNPVAGDTPAPGMVGEVLKAAARMYLPMLAPAAAPWIQAVNGVATPLAQGLAAAGAQTAVGAINGQSIGDIATNAALAGLSTYGLNKLSGAFTPNASPLDAGNVDIAAFDNAVGAFNEGSMTAAQAAQAMSSAGANASQISQALGGTLNSAGNVVVNAANAAGGGGGGILGMLGAGTSGLTLPKVGTTVTADKTEAQPPLAVSVPTYTPPSLSVSDAGTVVTGKQPSTAPAAYPVGTNLAAMTPAGTVVTAKTAQQKQDEATLAGAAAMQPTTIDNLNPQNEIVVKNKADNSLNGGIDAVLNGATAPLSVLNNMAPETPATPAAKPKTLKDYLEMAGLGATAISALLKATGGGNNGTPYTGLGSGNLSPSFSAKLPDANLPGAGGVGGAGGSGPRTASDLAVQGLTSNPQDWYRYGYGPQQSFFNYVPQGAPNTSQAYTGYAGGGDVDGPGTGRSDSIPARLSDGEYVMDAETVALLGDGSSKAGAKKLDAFRVNLRKQKGRNLAQGKFSVKAKAPEAYLAGGRT